jgi:hypothetical protein
MIWVWVKTCQDLWTYHMIKGITWNNHPKTSYLRDLGIFRVPRVPSRVPGFDPYGMNTEWCCSACSTALCFLKWLEVVTFRDDSMRKMTLVDYLSIPPPRTLQLQNLADVSHQFPPCPTSTNCPRLWNNMQWGQPYYHKYVLNIYIYIIIIYIIYIYYNNIYIIIYIYSILRFEDIFVASFAWHITVGTDDMPGHAPLWYRIKGPHNRRS